MAPTMSHLLVFAIMANLVEGVTYETGATIADLLADIKGQKDDVMKIIEHIDGAGKHESWEELAKWTDKFGGRLCGSQALEDSIDYLKTLLEAENLDSVKTEDVKVPKWTRGEESAYMTVGAYNKSVAITGLGTTVATPAGGITADVIVVHSFEELEKLGSAVAGKIVVYNQEWKGYGNTVQYRSGASRAAKLGAVATLVRSMTPYSLYTPHTGVQGYDDTVTMIHVPTAAITVEDAELMDRIIKRGKKVTVHIELGGENHGEVTSRNLIADITGSQYPEEIVMFGGHLDSWDLAEGAQDDGIGVFLGIQVLRIIKTLGLKPKRTMRFVGWTCEETGLYGSDQYFDRHWNSTREKVILAMQADIGVFNPIGIGFTANGLARKVMEEVMQYLEPKKLNAIHYKGESADTGRWSSSRDPSTPVANLWAGPIQGLPEWEYFQYHHTPADSMTALDRDEFDKAQIIWTVVSYAISNIGYQNPLPLDGYYPNPTLEEEVLEYQDEVHSIVRHVTLGAGKGVFWDDLAWWTDAYWARLCGSQKLEESIDSLKMYLENEGFSNVAKEEVTGIPRWERGNEHATLLKPRNKKLDILGLGSSVATPAAGITAKVLVVASFDELQEKKDLARDKIVVFNQEWQGYSNTHVYRSTAAMEGDRVGAVAVLVRSLATKSLSTPHTGAQDYGNATNHIPTASVTVEDAEMLHRMYKRGEEIEIYLYMEAKTYQGPVSSYNLVAEIPGWEHPEEVVIIGGHLDSWDVGQGAMDDGSGVFNAIETLKVIKYLQLKPRRTIRFVGWTCEEIGGSPGGNGYFNRHKNESGNIIIVMENDYGTFAPQGIGFTGSTKAMDYMKYLMQLMEPLNATKVMEDGAESDTYMWGELGVPMASYISAGFEDVLTYKYFNYHHTNADMMTMLKPEVLDSANAMWASIAYVLADMKSRLPTGPDPASITTTTTKTTTKKIDTSGVCSLHRIQLPMAIWVLLVIFCNGK